MSLDPLEGLRVGRDAMRRVQTLVERMTLPADQRRAIADALARLTVPGMTQLEALLDLVEQFGPPQAQLADIQKTIDAQREALDTMVTELDRVEASLDRLAAASEQLATLQAPFIAMAGLLLRDETESANEDGDAEAAEPVGDATDDDIDEGDED